MFVDNKYGNTFEYVYIVLSYDNKAQYKPSNEWIEHFLKCSYIFRSGQYIWEACVSVHYTE